MPVKTSHAVFVKIVRPINVVNLSVSVREDVERQSIWYVDYLMEGSTEINASFEGKSALLKRKLDW